MFLRLFAGLYKAADLFFALIAPLPPWVGVTLFSLLTALLVLGVTRTVSSAKAIRERKNRIKAEILAIRLYGEFPSVVALSVLRSLGHTAVYFFLNLRPLVFLFPLLFLFFLPAESRYGRRALEVGERTVLKIKLQPGVDWDKLQVVLPEGGGLRQTIPPVFIPALDEVDQEVEILKAPMEGAVSLRIGGGVYRKGLLVSTPFGSYVETRFWNLAPSYWTDPGEGAPRGDSLVKSVSLDYPSHRISFLGWRVSWLLLYLVETFLLAWFLRKPFGVEF